MKTDQNLRKIRTKQLVILLLIGYILVAYVCIHIGAVFNSLRNADKSSLEIVTNLEILEKGVVDSIKTKPFFIPEKEDLSFMIFISLFYIAGFLYALTYNKKYRLGKEHGSTAWAEKGTIDKIVDEDESYNTIFTETERMTLDNMKIRKNVNTVLIGSPATGKTRFFVKPNILQASCSYVITDPKGELLADTGSFFIEKGYRIKILNLKDMSSSMCYNPFVYIKKDTDVIKLIDCLISNTNKKEVQSTADPFWEKSEIALLQAIFYFIYYELVEEEHNFATVMELFRMAEAKEEDEGWKSDLDILFENLEKENPEHIACKQYKIFKLGAGKTIKSILISLGVRLSLFNLKEVSNLMIKDELELDTIGDEKTVLFVVIPDATDTMFNFIAAMMYTQLFASLYEVADSRLEKRLKIHVRCMLDEFANIGKIPNFEKLKDTMRSREISVVIIIQAVSQLKEMYEKQWEGIIGTCTAFLFLGSQELSTLEHISKMLGKETIDTRNINNSKGRNANTTWNYGITGRELMTPDEIRCIPDSDCILIISGMLPFYSKKYNLTKHKNYKYLADADEKNNFNFEKFREIENEKLAENEREKILERYNFKDFKLEQEQLQRLFFSVSNSLEDEEIEIEQLEELEEFDESYQSIKIMKNKGEK